MDDKKYQTYLGKEITMVNTNASLSKENWSHFQYKRKLKSTNTS
jgi:hypothetical protein